MTIMILLSTADGGEIQVLLIVMIIMAVLFTLVITFILIYVGVCAITNAVSCWYSPITPSSAALIQLVSLSIFNHASMRKKHTAFVT